MSDGKLAGKAYVELNVKNNLKRQLAQASDVLRGWASSIGMIGGALTAASGAGLGIFTHMAKSFADAGSKMYDFSKRTGVSAESLGSLGYAAEQSGSSVEAVAKSMSAMNRFTTALASGNEAAAKTMKDLGINSAAFLNASPEERLGMIADSLEQIEDPGIKAGMAMKVLGKSGTELLPMLEGGSAALKAMRAEAERLGIVLSKEEVAASDQFGDALSRTQKTVVALYQHIGAQLAPVLENVTNIITGLAAVAIRWVKVNQTAITILAGLFAVAGAAGIVLLGLAGFVWAASIAMGAYTTITTMATAVSAGCMAVVNALTASFAALYAVLGTVSIPVLLIVGSVIALAAAFAYATVQAYRLSAIGSASLTMFGEQVAGVFGSAGLAISGFADAMGSGQIESAMEIAAAGMNTVWKKAILSLSELFRGLREYVLSVWRSIQEGSVNAYISVLRLSAKAKDAMSGGNANEKAVDMIERNLRKGMAITRRDDKLKFDAERKVEKMASKALDKSLEDAIAKSEKKQEQAKQSRKLPRFEMPGLDMLTRGQSGGAFNAVAATNLGRTPQSMLDNIKKELEKANKLQEQTNKLLDEMESSWGA